MKYKAYTLHNFDQIAELRKISAADIEAIRTVAQVLPFKTNNYVVEQLINWEKAPDDPIFTLTFPRREMLSALHYEIVSTALKRGADKEQMKSIANKIRMQLNPHPAGQMEHNVPVFEGERQNGLQHKYEQTVLVFPSQGQTCHAYCTFCFRWPQFTGMNEMKFAMRESGQLAEYIAAHPEVTDVLFTGGDPMIMKTRLLEKYFDTLLEKNIPWLQTIRIGTKALAYWPYRFTSDEDADDLLRLFEKVTARGINLSVMAHFSHPAELETDAVKAAIIRIRSTGAQIRTQSPILRHINDNPTTWSQMWRKQVNLNCIPYYMFIPRDTGAQDYFALPLEEAWQIFRNAYKQVSGICRTVRGPSMSCHPGKVQLLGITQLGREKVMVLRMLQGRNPDHVGRPFFAKHNPDAVWFDELEPFGSADKHFFCQSEAAAATVNKQSPLQ